MARKRNLCSVTLRDMMDDNELKFLDIGAGGDRRALAVRAQTGAAPGLPAAAYRGRGDA